MKHNDLLHNEFNDLARKEDKKSTIILLGCTFLIILSFISLCAFVQVKSENQNLKWQLDQRDSLISGLKATNNEIIYDNLQLSNSR